MLVLKMQLFFGLMEIFFNGKLRRECANKHTDETGTKKDEHELLTFDNVRDL